MIMKHDCVAVATVLAALAITSIGVPAFAQTRAAPSWDVCHAVSIDRGSGPQKGGSVRENAQHDGFMNQCLEGKFR
jgi:hypothetical protein